ncbi:hypothetical protein [Roseibium sp. M-1]
MTGRSRIPGLDGFVIAARLVSWGIWGLGAALAAILLLAATFTEALTAFAAFLVLGYCASLLIMAYRDGKLLLPFGYIYREKQRAAFWIFLNIYSLLIPALLLGTAAYYLGV